MQRSNYYSESKQAMPEEVKETLAKPTLLRHEILQKFKTAKETKVPTLDQALRRAAAVGTIEDIDALLYYGAAINAQDAKNKYTALHKAVLKKRGDVVKHLLKKHASRHLKDVGGHTPDYYTKDDPELASIFAYTQSAMLRNSDTVNHILSFLSSDDLHSVQGTSFDWNHAVNETVIKQHFTKHGLLAQYERFKTLPALLKYIISHQMIDLHAKEKLEQLFMVLGLSPEERLKILYPENFATKNIKASDDILSDLGMALYLLGYIPIELDNVQEYLCKGYGALALAKGLLKSDTLVKSHTSSNHRNILEFLRFINSNKNVYIALQEKLLSEEDIINYVVTKSYGFLELFKLLFSDDGLTLLRKKIINANQLPVLTCSALIALSTSEAKQLFEDKILNFEECKEEREVFSKVAQIITPLGIKALRENLITQSHLEMKDLTAENLACLLSEEGLELLRDELVPWDVLVKIPDLKPLVTKNGLAALRNGYIDAKQLHLVKDLKNALSDEGIEALEKGFITFQDPIQRNSLAILKIPNALIALKEGLITLDQAEAFKDYGQVLQAHSLKVLLGENGLQALREKLITPEQAAHFYHSGSCSGPNDNLECLLSPTGLAALREGLIKPENAYNNPELYKAFPRDKLNKYVLAALRYKIFSLEETQYGKKYSFWNGCHINDLDSHLKKLVEEHERLHIHPKYNPECKENNSATVTLQKHWRGKKARQQFSLFRELNQCLKNANINDLDNLHQAKQLIESGKRNDCVKVCDVIKTINQRNFK